MTAFSEGSGNRLEELDCELIGALNDPRGRFLACLWRGYRAQAPDPRACWWCRVLVVGLWWVWCRVLVVGLWWVWCRVLVVGLWWVWCRVLVVGLWWVWCRVLVVGLWWVWCRVLVVGLWWVWCRVWWLGCGGCGVGFWWLGCGGCGVGFWWLGCGGVGRCCVGFRGLGWSWSFRFWVLGLVGGVWPGCCRRDIGLCRLGRGGGLGAGIGGLVPRNRAVSAACGEQPEQACDGSDPADCRGGHQPSIAVTACGLPTLTPFTGGRYPERVASGRS